MFLLILNPSNLKGNVWLLLLRPVKLFRRNAGCNFWALNNGLFLEILIVCIIFFLLVSPELTFSPVGPSVIGGNTYTAQESETLKYLFPWLIVCACFCMISLWSCVRVWWHGMACNLDVALWECSKSRAGLQTELRVNDLLYCQH